MESSENRNQEVTEVNLKDQISQYLRHWPWFVVSVIIAMALSFLYLRYATPIYNTVATILIKDEKNSALSELAAFQDLGFTGTLNPSGFENEIQILKSKSLTERVIKDLSLNISYISEGNIRDSEIFGDIPFKLEIVTPEGERQFPSLPFYIQPIDTKTYKIWLEDSNQSFTHQFGEVIQLPIAEVLVTSNERTAEYIQEKDEPIKVHIRDIPSTVALYRQNIVVERLMDMSSVIQLSLKAASTKKSEAVLNELIKQYNLDAIEDRNIVARNTANFINGRLEVITEELDSVETGKVEFKKSNRLMDLGAEGQIFLQSESEYNKQLMEVEVKLELIDEMIAYVKKAGSEDLLPTNIGIERDGISSAINMYNEVVLERSRLLGSSTEKNPAIVNLTEQLRGLRANVLEGLNNAKRGYQIQRNDFIGQEAVLGAKMLTIPTKEKISRSISRQQEIKETLYLYLLQKREENAISMVVTTPKAKIVDYAYSSLLPVSPKKNIILLAALVVGLLIPFSIIYLKNLLDDKIRSKADIIEVDTSTPIIGEIPKLDRKTDDLVKENDRSVLAEAFRILRTNLRYLFINLNTSEGAKTIFVTSTIKGEGKTFVSFNLALTLANAGAKVILVGADIRNPQIHRYTNRPASTKGVVEYLINRESTVEDYIVSSELHGNLDLIYSGAIPPNPAELWMSDRTKTFFQELKQKYDYVIVDTAPSMLVTDTLLINHHSDVLLYVMRENFTLRKMLDFPVSNIRNKKFKNVAYVLNNVNMDNLGYGSQYGYYYVDRDSFFKKIKKSLFG